MISKTKKRAISPIVSYGILIAIIVSLSVIIYGYLKLYLPPETPSCPDGVEIIAQDIECNYSLINLTLSNRGRFNISGAYLRIGAENRSVRHQITSQPRFLHPLSPGDAFSEIYDVGSVVTYDGPYVLEIQPIIIKDREDILCTSATTIQDIFCSN